MGLMDAAEYDPEPARRRNIMIGLAVLTLAALTILYFVFRYWPEEHAIDSFFQAIEQKDFEKAYGLYNADSGWKQHPQQFVYSFSQFSLDWGPSSEYGVITSHHVDCAAEPRKSGFQSATGIVVVVTINNRITKSMWVEKKTKEIHFSPLDGVCQ